MVTRRRSQDRFRPDDARARRSGRGFIGQGLAFALWIPLFIPARGAAQEHAQLIDVKISLDQEIYYRGETDPVKGLIVSMTVTNTERNRMAVDDAGRPVRTYKIERSPEKVVVWKSTFDAKTKLTWYAIEGPKQERASRGKIKTLLDKEKEKDTWDEPTKAEFNDRLQQEIKKIWGDQLERSFKARLREKHKLDPEDLQLQSPKPPTRVELGGIPHKGHYVHFPAPNMGPEGGVRFDIFRQAPAIVEPTEPEAEPAAAAKRARIIRSPPLQPTGRGTFFNDVSLAPQESRSFRLNAGKAFAIREPGRYEITAVFQGVRSQTLEFEVAPLKRVSVRVDRLLERIEDYERGKPTFSHMFYIVPTGSRYDLVFALYRIGSGRESHYERKDICRIRVGASPQMVSAGSRVGLLVADRWRSGLYYRYIVDFEQSPIHVERDRYEFEQAGRPRLVKTAEGDFAVELQDALPRLEYIIQGQDDYR